jgi:hypothetical protein
MSVMNTYIGPKRAESGILSDIGLNFLHKTAKFRKASHTEFREETRAARTGQREPGLLEQDRQDRIITGQTELVNCQLPTVGQKPKTLIFKPFVSFRSPGGEKCYTASVLYYEYLLYNNRTNGKKEKFLKDHRRSLERRNEMIFSGSGFCVISYPDPDTF